MEKRSTQLLRSWKRLAAELVVVFLGVYGAFWVENYRDQQDRIDRTEQVILALQQDLRDYVEVTDAFNKHVEDGLRDWAGARESGEAPAPFVFRIYGAETPPLSTWEVVRQAELAELLQANLLYELGFFYNEIAGMGARYIRYAEFTESEVPRSPRSGAPVSTRQTESSYPDSPLTWIGSVSTAASWASRLSGPVAYSNG